MNENFWIFEGTRTGNLIQRGRGASVVNPEWFFSNPDLTFQTVPPHGQSKYSLRITKEKGVISVYLWVTLWYWSRERAWYLRCGGVVPEMWVLCGRGRGGGGLAGGCVLVAAVPALRDPVAHVVDGDAVAWPAAELPATAVILHRPLLL